MSTPLSAARDDDRAQSTDSSLAVGEILHGFCGGWLGRDHYSCSRVESLGVDWVVVRQVDGDGLAFASGRLTLAHLRRYRTPIEGDPAYPCCEEASRG